MSRHCLGYRDPEFFPLKDLSLPNIRDDENITESLMKDVKTDRTYTQSFSRQGTL